MIDGALGALGLFAFYLTLMRLFTGSWEAGLAQFRQLQWYMFALITSFGVNIAVIQFLKCRHTKPGFTKTSTTGSTAAMVLCCAHHVTDVLPVIGLSGAIVFLSTYQKVFLVIGILSNCAFTAYNLTKTRTVSINPS